MLFRDRLADRSSHASWLFLLGTAPVKMSHWFVIYQLDRRAFQRFSLLFGLFVLSLLLMTYLMPVEEHVPVKPQPIECGGLHGSQINSPLTNEKICGQPGDVFRQLGFSVSNVLKKSVLSLLPTPRQKSVIRAGDISYDPSKNELCTLGWQGIYTRYIQPLSANNTENRSLKENALKIKMGVTADQVAWRSDI